MLFFIFYIFQCPHSLAIVSNVFQINFIILSKKKRSQVSLPTLSAKIKNLFSPQVLSHFKNIFKLYKIWYNLYGIWQKTNKIFKNSFISVNINAYVSAFVPTDCKYLQAFCRRYFPQTCLTLQLVHGAIPLAEKLFVV